MSRNDGSKEKEEIWIIAVAGIPEMGRCRGYLRIEAATSGIREFTGINGETARTEKMSGIIADKPTPATSGMKGKSDSAIFGK